MAYNPFNIFRRNQKALFAVLTVFIMVMFTLQSGVAGGDFFESIMRWLGAKGGSKEEVCRIDGHRVTIGELDSGPRSLQYKRTMANRFMYYAARQSSREIEAYANSQRERLSPQGRDMADAARRALEAIDQLNQPWIRNNPQVQEFLLPQKLEQIDMGQQLVDATLESSLAKSEDKDAARAFRTAFNLRKYLQEGQGEHYFLNAPNKTRRDLIEFMLGEKKADQLGIRFSKDDVNKLIQNDFSNFFKNDVPVRDILKGTPGFTMDAVLSALASEFKVRAAQTAVLGQAGRFHGGPALTTPYEMFEFYRDKISPAEYEVLSVPATAFLDKVTAEPTDDEVNVLFKKYADVEPNPKSETPGFKDPRKISISWLGIKGDEPYYKNLATEQIKVGEVLAKASGALAVPLPGAVGTWAAGAVAPLSLKEPAVDAAYARRTETFRTELGYKYTTSRISSFDLLPSSTVRPGVVAATVGGFVANPMAGLAHAMSAPIAYEIRDRAKVGLPLVLGTIPGPAMLQTSLVGVAAARTHEPKPLPIEAMRPELLKQTIDDRAKVLAFGDRQMSRDPEQDKLREKGDIARFTEELAKLTENGKPKDPVAVDKYIKEFITSRGIKEMGGSTPVQPGNPSTARDEWTLEDDPGLAPLLDAHKASVIQAKFMRAHGGTEPYLPFGRPFFWRPDEQTRRIVPTSGTYLAETYPSEDRGAATAEGRTHFVIWRTEDIQPKKTLNLSTGRSAVVAAWKRQKARDLALAHANMLAEKIRTDPNNDPALLFRLMNDLKLSIKDPKADARARVFQIKGVAPLTLSPPSPFGGPGQLRPFGLPDSEEIPYPTVEMVTALVENRDKGPKTVLVLPDAPKDTFYVAALRDRKMKQASEFTPDVISERGGARAIQRLFRDDTVTKARQSVLELLKKEFKYEETDDQKKKLDENTKTGGRNND